MLHAILLFSLGVTALCCYTLHIITKERESLDHHRYTALHEFDIKAVKRPSFNVSSRPSPFKRTKEKFSKTSPIIDIIDHVDNFYPISPRLSRLDVRV